MRIGRRHAAHLLVAWVIAQAPLAQCREPVSSSSNHYVVSYLLSKGPDSSAWVPEEGLPSDTMPQHPWEWRFYDPATRRDHLFLRLSSFPLDIRWDSSFTSVEFHSGHTIVRAPWRPGAELQKIVDLPADSSLCDFWMDAAGEWHVVTQREVMVPLPDGRRIAQNVGTRWDRSRSTGTWDVAVIDSEAGDQYGGCFVTPKLQGRVPPPNRFRVVDHLDAMGLDPRRVSILFDGSGGSEDTVWVASAIDSSLGLEMCAWMGDTYHAKEPVAWVDHKRGRRKTVYPSGRSDVTGQIASEERDATVLIISQGDGGYPTIVDMRTGRVLFHEDRPSARAIWVPAPR